MMVRYHKFVVVEISYLFMRYIPVGISEKSYISGNNLFFLAGWLHYYTSMKNYQGWALILQIKSLEGGTSPPTPSLHALEVED